MATVRLKSSNRPFGRLAVEMSWDASLTRLTDVQVNRKTFVTDYGVPYRDLRILDPLVSLLSAYRIHQLMR